MCAPISVCCLWFCLLFPSSFCLWFWFGCSFVRRWFWFGSLIVLDGFVYDVGCFFHCLTCVVCLYVAVFHWFSLDCSWFCLWFWLGCFHCFVYASDLFFVERRMQYNSVCFIFTFCSHAYFMSVHVFHVVSCCVHVFSVCLFVSFMFSWIHVFSCCFMISILSVFGSLY